MISTLEQDMSRRFASCSQHQENDSWHQLNISAYTRAWGSNAASGVRSRANFANWNEA